MIKNTPLYRLIRFTNERIVCTGGVVFIGEGSTGKTHTAINMTGYKPKGVFNEKESSIKKSLNLEMNYFVLHSNIEEYQITTSSQIYIMPGQKGFAEKGKGLAFEDALDLFFRVSSIDVVLSLVLTYDLTDLNTFQELEFWLEKAIERDMIKEYTSIVILGTHLDKEEEILVEDEYIANAREYVQNYIEEKTGLQINIENIYAIKISNTDLAGIDELIQAINKSFINAFRITEMIGNSKKMEKTIVE